MTLACQHCFGPLTRGRCTRCNPRHDDGLDVYFDDGDPDARRAGQVHGFWSDDADCLEDGSYGQF